MRAARAQLRAELLAFLREPADLFFSVALPVLFLVLFTSIFGNEPVEGRPDVRAAQRMVPGFVCFAVIASGFTSLVINLVGKRERGLLKRVRATPAPSWVLLAAIAAKSTLVGAAVTVVLIVVGRVGYDVTLPLDQVPALVVTLLVGAVAITCLGVAATVLVGSEGAASAITNAMTLPLFFISGVFIPAESLPRALLTIGSLFPVRHLYDALVHVFDPGSGRAGFAPADLAVVAAWGVAGFLVANRTFRPFPRRDRE